MTGEFIVTMLVWLSDYLSFGCFPCFNQYGLSVRRVAELLVHIRSCHWPDGHTGAQVVSLPFTSQMWRNHAWSCSRVASDLAAAPGDFWTHFSLGGVDRPALAHLKGNSRSLMCLCNGERRVYPTGRAVPSAFLMPTQKRGCVHPHDQDYLQVHERGSLGPAQATCSEKVGTVLYLEKKQSDQQCGGRGRRPGQKEQIQALSLAAAPRILRVNKMQLTECLFRGYIFMTKISGSEMYSFPWLSGWLFSIRNSSVRFPKLDKSLRLIISGM